MHTVTAILNDSEDSRDGTYIARSFEDVGEAFDYFASLYVRLVDEDGDGDPKAVRTVQFIEGGVRGRILACADRKGTAFFPKAVTQ